MTKSCENCEFYVRHHTYREKGDCHRFPPSLPGSDARGDLWPFMRFNQWCGEFKEKVKEPQYKTDQPIVNCSRHNWAPVDGRCYWCGQPMGDG